MRRASANRDCAAPAARYVEMRQRRKPMRLTPLIALIWSGAALAAPPTPATDASAHPLAGAILRVSDGAAMTPDALAGALAAADVAIIGETHDNAEHHAAQAWLTAALAPGALAFEMIGRDRENALARLRAEGASRAALGAALDWENSGWPAFDLYAPILEAAPGAVVTGALIGREASGAAMRDGAAAAGRAALGAAVARYGLDRALAAAQAQDAAAEQIDAHCGALPQDVAGRMVEAQRLRDAALADAALRGRALADDGAVVMITGNGHARTDRGAPRYLAEAAPELSVVSVMMAEVAEGRDDWRAYVTRGAEGGAVADYVWFTAAAPREDPCEAYLRARAQP